jgi:hypothetical protein
MGRHERQAHEISGAVPPHGRLRTRSLAGCEGRFPQVADDRGLTVLPRNPCTRTKRRPPSLPELSAAWAGQPSRERRACVVVRRRAEGAADPDEARAKRERSLAGCQGRNPPLGRHRGVTENPSQLPEALAPASAGRRGAVRNLYTSFGQDSSHEDPGTIGCPRRWLDGDLHISRGARERTRRSSETPASRPRTRRYLG